MQIGGGGCNAHRDDCRGRDRHGGRRELRVVGDGDGRVGMGKGKSKEVPAAVQKAMEEARRNLTKMSLIDPEVNIWTHKRLEEGVRAATAVLVRRSKALKLKLSVAPKVSTGLFHARSAT